MGNTKRSLEVVLTFLVSTVISFFPFLATLYMERTEGLWEGLRVKSIGEGISILSRKCEIP